MFKELTKPVFQELTKTVTQELPKCVIQELLCGRRLARRGLHFSTRRGHAHSVAPRVRTREPNPADWQAMAHLGPVTVARVWTRTLCTIGTRRLLAGRASRALL